LHRLLLKMFSLALFSPASMLLAGLVGGVSGLVLPEGSSVHEEWLQEFGHDTFKYPVRIVLLTKLTLLTLNVEGLGI
jgi:hypothetical protein